MSQAIDDSRTAAGAADEVSALPVRGRRTEQELLTQWVRRHVHRNGGGVLWIEGPPGAGRSRMLAGAGTEAALAGARVLTGAGLARGQLTPLAPLLDALSAETDGLAHGPRAGSPEEGESYWLLREVGDRLRALALERPLVLLLDDVHDCDDLTLLAVRTLTTRLAGLPLLWVLASRAHPDAPAVRTLRRDLLSGRATHLELPPLAPEAVRQMAQDILGPRAAAAAPYLPYLDGLPGLVRQFCAHLRHGSPTAAEGPADASTVLAPLVTRRLHQLSEDGRELVLTASVLGGSLTVKHLSQVMGRREPTLLRPLREVLAAQLLHAGHDRLSFPHTAVREAIAATLPGPVRTSIRRRLVEARMKAGVPAVSLASELVDLAEPGDAQAGRVLRAAAQELAAVAPGSAARYLKRAVELTADVCPERQRLSAELIPLLWQSGDIAGARDLARRVVQAAPDALTHAEACLELARMGSQFHVRQPEVQVRHVHRRRDVPVALKDQLLLTTLLNRLLAGEAGEAGGGGMAESLMRTRGTHPVSELTHRILRSMSACHRHHWADALKHSEAAAAGIAHLDPAHAATLPEVALATSWRAALLGLSGDDRSARDLVEEAANEAEQRGRRALLPLWRSTRARLLLDAGQLAEAARELASAETEAAATGVSFMGESAALCTRARVAFHMGDDAAMEECAARADACLSGDDPRQRGIGAWVTLIAMAYRDDLGPAERHLPLAMAHARRGYVHALPVDPAETVLLVRIALGAGLRDDAVSVVEFAEHRAQRGPRFSQFAAVATHVRGLLDGDPDRLLAAAERYGTARPLLGAEASEDAGALLAEAGSPEARDRFERALEGYEACGAHRNVRRVRGRLRKLGVKPGAKPGTAAPAADVPGAGWRGLTPSELGVVRLIAHGATNRQAAERLFVSPHTVNTHVRHAFEKLGIRSRVQLARLYLTEVDQRGAVG